MSDGITDAFRNITISKTISEQYPDKVKVYICSPYTIGWQSENVRRQLEAASILMEQGFAPYTPLLTHFQAIFSPRSEADWLALDLEYLKVCAFIIRIHPRDKNNEEIPSAGADIEEKLAKELNIPVYHINDVNALPELLRKIKAKANLDIYL